jgi:hypothetical protein
VRSRIAARDAISPLAARSDTRFYDRLLMAVRPTATAPAGTVIYVAGAEPHTFANPSGRPARMLVVLLPAGFERFFRDGAAQGRLLAPETLARLNAEHGVELMG